MESAARPYDAPGLRAKFQQNPDLLEKLMDTGNMILAECAPRDKIWGIGLAVDDARIQNPRKWIGWMQPNNNSKIPVDKRS